MGSQQRRTTDSTEPGSHAISAAGDVGNQSDDREMDRLVPQSPEKIPLSLAEKALPDPLADPEHVVVCTCSAPDAETEDWATPPGKAFVDTSQSIKEPVVSTTALPELNFSAGQLETDVADKLIPFTKRAIPSADEISLRQTITDLTNQLAVLRLEKTSLEKSLADVEASFDELEIRCNEMSDHIWAIEASVGFVKEDVIKETFIRLSYHTAAWCDEASYHAGECGMNDSELRTLSLDIGLKHSLDKARLPKITSAVIRAIVFRKLSKEVFYNSTANLLLSKDLFLSEDEARRVCRLEQKLLEEGMQSLCSCANAPSQ
jgi:hypothetical protein